jgi:predicted transcriptional regulator
LKYAHTISIDGMHSGVFLSYEKITSRLPDVELQDYHRTLIEEGIRQCDAGQVVDHETVLNMVAQLIRKPKKG